MVACCSLGLVTGPNAADFCSDGPQHWTEMNAPAFMTLQSAQVSYRAWYSFIPRIIARRAYSARILGAARPCARRTNVPQSSRFDGTPRTTRDAIDATKPTADLHHEDLKTVENLTPQTQNTSRPRHCSAMATLYVGFSKLPKGIS